MTEQRTIYHIEPREQDPAMRIALRPDRMIELTCVIRITAEDAATAITAIQEELRGAVEIIRIDAEDLGAHT